MLDIQHTDESEYFSVRRGGEEERRFAARRAVHLTVSLAWSVPVISAAVWERPTLITSMHYDLTATFVV